MSFDYPLFSYVLCINLYNFSNTYLLFSVFTKFMLNILIFFSYVLDL